MCKGTYMYIPLEIQKLKKQNTKTHWPYKKRLQAEFAIPPHHHHQAIVFCPCAKEREI